MGVAVVKDLGTIYLWKIPLSSYECVSLKLLVEQRRNRSADEVSVHKPTS